MAEAKEPRPLVVGDKVQWCHTIKDKDGVEFRTWYGKITKVENMVATVRRKGLDYTVPALDLKPQGKQSHLMDAFDEAHGDSSND
jgi:hypothetical protein